MKIKVKKLTPDAILPAYKHESDSGMDICANESYSLGHDGAMHLFSTGIAAVIPHGYGLSVRPRSGLAANSKVWAVYGTVDQGYRGEIKILLINMGHEHYSVNKGDRIAQLVLEKIEQAEIEETADIGAITDRGENGFGSTGVRD